MRFVIATGIYPPEIGGPALYAAGVKKALEETGHEAPVVLYGILRRFPTGLRHLLYACKLFVSARGADAIIAFDTYSAGVPAVWAARALGVRVLVRVGGDFVWESYVERTGARVPLPDFYARLPRLSIKERFAFVLVRSMLRHAELAFNTQWLIDIWRPVYGFSGERAHVAENIIPERIASEGTDTTMLLYGRSLVLKNAPAFRRAFARARKQGMPLSLEERAVPHAEFIERVRGAYAVAVPSVSDVAPNTIIDAMICGKPFLLTKYSGYAEKFGEYGVIVNPLDEEDMARGMEHLADEKNYAALREKIKRFDRIRTYMDVARDFLEILGKSSMLREGICILQLGSDRSSRGILHPASTGFKRQEAYAKVFDALDIIGFSLRSDAAQRLDSNSLHVHPTDSTTKLLYGLDAIRIARRLPRPDIVTVQDPFETGLVGLILARRFRVPLHVQVHTDFLSPEYARHSLLNRFRVFLAGYVLRRATRVRVVSDRIKQSIEKKYQLSAPITVLPIFVHIDTHALVDISAENKLLWVGRLEPEKNPQLALTAFVEARKAGYDASLSIVGTGSLEGKLREQAVSLGVEHSVTFEGPQDAMPYITACSLLLVTSRYEGYGLVIVEALAAGKPVLSTDVGVAREVGAIVTTPERFADALKEWLQSGPREGHLMSYPYKSFDEYIEAYRADIAACVQK